VTATENLKAKTSKLENLEHHDCIDGEPDDWVRREAKEWRQTDILWAFWGPTLRFGYRPI